MNHIIHIEVYACTYNTGMLRVSKHSGVFIQTLCDRVGSAPAYTWQRVTHSSHWLPWLRASADPVPGRGAEERRAAESKYELRGIDSESLCCAHGEAPTLSPPPPRLKRIYYSHLGGSRIRNNNNNKEYLHNTFLTNVTHKGKLWME